MPASMRVVFQLTETVDGVTARQINVENNHVMTELLDKMITLSVGAVDVDLTPDLQSLGTAGEVRFLVIISDTPGVVANIATQADVATDNDNTVTLPCYPFLAFGADSPYMDVSSPDFELTLSAPSSLSARVRIIAYQ